MDKVDRLYELYNILDEAGDKIADHEAEYKEIIGSVKGKGNEKGLACQFIPKFLKHFPHLASAALEAQLDLAEDDDVTIRKLAVKNLPLFCKVSKNFIPKIGDILTQMLQVEDSGELSTVNAALVAIMEVDMELTLKGIFTQIETTEEDSVRKCAIEFLNLKFKVLPEDLITKQVEEFLLESCKTILPKVSGQDFLNFLPLLSNLKIAKTVPVQNTIVEIIATQLDMDAEFDVSDNSISGFMHFLNQASHFFSPYVNSKKFVSYICLKIFPKLEEIKGLENGINLALDLFKGLAEISAFIRKDDDMNECAEIVFKELLNFVPLPPDTDDDSKKADPDLYFTHIECLLFTFVQFLKCNDEMLTGTDHVDRFKDLKLRLQFLSRVITRALKQITESWKTKKYAAIEEKEEALKLIAEETLNNISALIKDFFRSPPSFKTTIKFSWKSQSGPGTKRLSDALGSDNKRGKRACRELYVPPSGKYSSGLKFL